MEKKTFYIETYGCTSNKADSNIISNVLNKLNYKQETIDRANFIIVNTCGVKQQTENKIKARLKFLYNNFKKSSKKHIIITGCLPFIDNTYIDVIREIIPNFSAIVDLDNIHEFPEIIDQINAGNKNLIIKSQQSIEKAKYLIDYPPSKITGIVPISEGCLGNCSYCCVKNARGRLNCYNPKNIIENIEYQLKQGIKQIYLTSQDCSTYQYNNTKLIDLVKNIAKLNHKFFLRIGMLNPRFLIENLNQLISIFTLKNIYQFLHIPIQSGSDKVLESMNRPYNIAEVIANLKILKNQFPYLTISTDIICGFPGEKEDDFADTLNFIKWLQPEILNISKFTPRPGTKAKRMKQINSRIIKERSIRLSKLFRESLLGINKNWIDWEGEVLSLHRGKKKNQAFGRNFAYKNIYIDEFKGNYGEFHEVFIYNVNGFNLYGRQT